MSYPSAGAFLTGFVADIRQAFLFCGAARHTAVARVRYAGLPSHADHDLAKRMFGERGFRALITFDLARDEAGSSGFVDDLSPGIPHIASMGDVTTTFLHIRACFGKEYEPSTIRLSVGVEPAEQIVGFLQKALLVDADP